jgi:hypothetical protein
VGAFRKALHTKRLARSDEPQDDFLTLWTGLRELYRARGQEDDLSDRVSLEKDGLSSPVGALMGERNNSFAVFWRDFREQRKMSNRLSSLLDDVVWITTAWLRDQTSV